MWRLIRDLIVLPIQAVFTGRVQGVQASRNPLHWLPLWGAALFVVPLLVLLYPVYIVWMLAGGWILLRYGAGARIAESGIEVFSKSKGPIAFYAWDSVRSLSLTFMPPGWCPQVTLSSGEVVPLPLADFEALAVACEARGVPVDRERGFGAS
jgi:hypothetical protein